ncbi:helix-turn-helix domain-containing protein [Streptomyces scabiei]|uniref:helix-turn-helix domain-containing protein n=1 Tax=Streptomyces scabiei TaxID=1930 RepID=UPI003674A9F0
MRIFETFTPDEPALTVSEISRRTGLHPMTASRLMGELLSHGFLTRDTDRRGRIGVRLWEPGAQTLPTKETPDDPAGWFPLRAVSVPPACEPEAPASAPPSLPARHSTGRAEDVSPMPRQQVNGTANQPGATVGQAPAPPPRPLHGPWVPSSASKQPPGSRATPSFIYSAAGQTGWSSSERRRIPNPRAADSVRSGKVDDPTGRIERFRRSETCKGGAGGTRTHGRRIMSPLRILAVLVNQCRFTPFLQVRRVHLCRPSAVLGGWFLSLRSLRGPCRSL